MADNTGLHAFLNAKQCCSEDWEATQTVAPTDVAAGAPTSSSITLTWSPIANTTKGGGYRVFLARTSGGPYSLAGITAGKTVSSLTITGLTPAETYYFVVQTVTDPHSGNANTVASDYSSEVSCRTTQ